MATFVEIPEEESYWTYQSGKITVTARKYLCGQYRLQIWYDLGLKYPGIIPPEC